MSIDDPDPEDEMADEAGPGVDSSEGQEDTDVQTPESPNSMMVELRSIVAEAKKLGDSATNSSKAAEAAVAEIEAAKQNIEETTKDINEKLPETAATITAAEKTCGKIDELHTQATSASKEVDNLVSTLTVAEHQVDELNGDLDSWRSKFAEYETTILGLLPGATSAGLASAFATRKGKFWWPKLGWAIVFIACICGLLALAVNDNGDLYSFFGLSESSATSSPATLSNVANWPEFFLLIFQKLILAGPLIWLAFYASRQHGLCQRLDEDYAYKETISRAFEGYKLQLSKLDSEEKKTLAGTLAENVLDVLNERPGRLYDKEIKSVSPGHVAADKLQSLLQTFLVIKNTTKDAAALKAVDEGIMLATKLLKP